MNKTIAIINGHPDSDTQHLCHGLADAYADGAKEAGHDIRRIDVARLDFPVMRTKQEFEEGSAPPDIKLAQDAIKAANHLVVIYPLWLGTMPALLKAFLEQVFRPGFAIEQGSKGWPAKLLTGRSARIIITMGMPAFVYRWYFLAHSLRSLERSVLKLGGISPVHDTIYGMVEEADSAKRGKWLNEMIELGHRAK